MLLAHRNEVATEHVEEPPVVEQSNVEEWAAGRWSDCLVMLGLRAVGKSASPNGALYEGSMLRENSRAFDQLWRLPFVLDRDRISSRARPAMEPHRGPKSGRNNRIPGQQRGHLDSWTGLELESSNLTAGRDLNISISAIHKKHSLPDARQLAQWLSSSNQYQFHKDVFDKVTKGTGQWIFQEPKFVGWLAREIDVLWGTGIPGAGKTCLSSVIIDFLIHLEQTAVVFFYCRYKEQPSTSEVLACLLRQMVERSEDAAQYVAMTLYASCVQTDTRPSQSELSEALNEAAQMFDSLFFVVDALDELADDTRSDLVTELSALQFPLLMTSRPLPNLLDLTPIEFTVQPPDNDFYTFISARISRVSKLRPFLRDSNLRAEIIKTIQDKCDGMFLLAALQIEALASASIINARSLREAVSQLPVTLNEQYKATVQRIQCQSPGERDLAWRIILWVKHATRPLEVDELLEALIVDLKTAVVDEDQRTTEETLISVCLGLLTVEKESRTVRFIHFTAQEFFEDQIEYLQSPHTFIAHVCAVYLTWIQVDCLTFTSLEELLQQKPDNHLIEYSCRNLNHHVHQASVEENDQAPMDVLKLFIGHGRALIPLTQALTLTGLVDFGYTVHFAAAYGLISLFDGTLDVIDQLSSNGCTPLFYACLGGHSMLVEHIVTRHKASLTYQTKFDATPLHAAVQSGSSDVVKRLLLMCELAGTPLHTVQQIRSSMGKDIPIDVNAQMSNGQTALYMASEAGNIPTVEALLACATIDPNPNSSSRSSPLHISLKNGHEGVAKLLLECPKINVNLKNYWERTPLHYAALYQRESITRLLLNVPGIEINAKEKLGQTPLYLAARIGHEPTLKLLLGAPGVEITAKSIEGLTPLHVAAELGHISAVRLLLHSLRVHIVKNMDGHNLSHLETHDGQAAIRSPITSFGPDAPKHIGDFTSLPPKICNATDLLLDSTYKDTDMRTDHGSTPLAYAASFGHTSIVQILLDSASVNINSVDNDGDTPLMCAAYDGHASVARLLLNHPEILVNVQDKQRHRTALSKACDAARHFPIGGTKTEEAAYSFTVVLLEHKDIDINLADDEGNTPLDYALLSGFHKVVELMEGRGAVTHNMLSLTINEPL